MKLKCWYFIYSSVIKTLDSRRLSIKRTRNVPGDRKMDAANFIVFWMRDGVAECSTFWERIFVFQMINFCCGTLTSPCY